MDTLQDTFPDEFVARMRGWLGDEAPLFFDALAQRDVGLRANTLRAPVSEIVERIPWKTTPVPWCPEGLWLREKDVALGVHPYHVTGAYYVQDPSAMAAGVLLDPRPGEWVLDLASAPGGKATHLASRMGGRGVLVANEVVRRRASVLAMNLERMGVTNALVTNEYPDQLAERWPRFFDAVLVDAPCSGEGMFCRDQQSISDWSIATVEGNARRQGIILEQAAPMVRQGGRILYGTCTFSPEENEGVISEFLATHPDFELIELPDLPGLHPGHPEWIGAPEALKRTGRFWPHTGAGHGHFYAMLHRKGDLQPLDDERWPGSDVPGRVLHLYRKGVGEALSGSPPEEGLILTENDDLYVTPMDPDLWHGLRVLRPGWWVASLRHNKVRPDHAMAMGLRPEEARTVVCLEPDDPRIDTFLRGGHWTDSGKTATVLITVDGFPLGWGKRGGGRLRSRYPVHLRRA